MTLVLEALSAVLVLTGSLFVLVSAVAMHRVHDALSRINSLSPATGMGLTAIVVGAWVHRVAVTGFTVGGLVKTLVTLAALLLVSSIASNTLGRAAVLSGAPVDPRTAPNDLASGAGEGEEPSPDHGAPARE